MMTEKAAANIQGEFTGSFFFSQDIGGLIFLVNSDDELDSLLRFSETKVNFV